MTVVIVATTGRPRHIPRSHLSDVSPAAVRNSLHKRTTARTDASDTARTLDSQLHKLDDHLDTVTSTAAPLKLICYKATVSDSDADTERGTIVASTCQHDSRSLVDQPYHSPPPHYSQQLPRHRVSSHSLSAPSIRARHLPELCADCSRVVRCSDGRAAFLALPAVLS